MKESHTLHNTAQIENAREHDIPTLHSHKQLLDAIHITDQKPCYPVAALIAVHTYVRTYVHMYIHVLRTPNVKDYYYYVTILS